MNVILHELYSGGMQFLLVLEHNFCSETWIIFQPSLIEVSYTKRDWEWVWVLSSYDLWV